MCVPASQNRREGTGRWYNWRDPEIPCSRTETCLGFQRRHQGSTLTLVLAWEKWYTQTSPCAVREKLLKFEDGGVSMWESSGRGSGKLICKNADNAAGASPHFGRGVDLWWEIRESLENTRNKFWHNWSLFTALPDIENIKQELGFSSILYSIWYDLIIFFFLWDSNTLGPSAQRPSDQADG